MSLYRVSCLWGWLLVAWCDGVKKVGAKKSCKGVWAGMRVRRIVDCYWRIGLVGTGHKEVRCGLWGQIK